jgi:CheY-like chemotaxis protein
LQKLTNEGFSMVTTKPLLKVPCMEILTKYGHVLPPNILSKLGPAADSQETSSSALTSAWSEDSSAVMSPALTFLVVEDNKTSWRILQRIIEREGFTVSFAVNGIEAVEKAKESDFSAILMDGNLPLKDGWQATREIREWEVARGTKRIPIIAITANAMRGDRELCIDAGSKSSTRYPEIPNSSDQNPIPQIFHPNAKSKIQNFKSYILNP